MEKILNSFKNLYTGEDVAKRHLMLALLFIFPCAMGATLQMINEDSKSTIIPLLIAAGILGLLSIIPLCMLTGTFINFIHRRFKELPGIPEINMDTLIQGIKVIPLYFVWGLYVLIPCFVYTTLVIVCFVASGIFSKGGDSISAVLGVLGILFFICLLIIPLFIISPFISLVYMKYCENRDYSSGIFNPALLFRYIRESFKEVIIVALKFVVVSIVTSFAAQLVMVFGVILILIIGMMFVIAMPENSNPSLNPAFLTTVIILSGLLGCVTGYVQFITTFAYVDNLQDIYKEKFMVKTEEEQEVETVQETPEE